MAGVRIGVVGCGRIAQSIHLRIVPRIPGVRLVALAEPDAGLRSRARKIVPDATLFDDYHSLITGSDAEAIVVCLPPGLHAEAAIAALEADKHVYLEKPIATTLTDAKAVIDAWRSRASIGMIGFNYRFSPSYRSARDLVRAGKLGEFVAVRTVFSCTSTSMPEWKRSRKSGGGALLDLGSHHIDMIRFLLGEEIVEVHCDLRSTRSDDDTAIAHFHLAGGLMVQSLFSIDSVEEDRFEIYGDHRKLTVDRYAAVLELTGPDVTYNRLKRLYDEGRSAARRLRQATRSPGEPSFRLALERFVSAIQGGAEAAPDLEDGYRSLKVVFAAEQSATERRPVTMASL